MPRRTQTHAAEPPEMVDWSVEMFRRYGTPGCPPPTAEEVMAYGAALRFGDYHGAQLAILDYLARVKPAHHTNAPARSQKGATLP